MYQEFYGLREKPFSLTPDPKFLYLSEYHRGALEHVLYGLRQKEGFITITGGIGTGKTTICRAILDRLDNRTKSALVLNPLLSEEELLREILQDFGIIPKGLTHSQAAKNLSKKELIDALNAFLLKQCTKGGSAVLIIDEAQNLSIPVLEQVRILSNLETEKEKLLQIVLVGQEELRQKLDLPKLRQLNQRISIRYHIYPLSREETIRYIDHRLMVAGANRSVIFAKGGLNLIYKFSQGVPRLINLACDRALLGGYTEQTRHISKDLVRRGIGSLSGVDAKFTSPSSSLTGKIKSLLKLNLLILLLLFLLFYQINPSFELKPSDMKARFQETMGFYKDKIWGSRKAQVLAPSTQKTVQNVTPPPQKPATKVVPSGKEVPKNNSENGERFSIQLHSFQDTLLARQKLEELKKKGYDAYIYPIELPSKGRWNRIMVGRFKDLKTAHRIAEELRRRKEISSIRIVSTNKEQGK